MLIASAKTMRFSWHDCVCSLLLNQTIHSAVFDAGQSFLVPEKQESSTPTRENAESIQQPSLYDLS